MPINFVSIIRCDLLTGPQFVSAWLILLCFLVKCDGNDCCVSGRCVVCADTAKDCGILPSQRQCVWQQVTSSDSAVPYFIFFCILKKKVFPSLFYDSFRFFSLVPSLKWPMILILLRSSQCWFTRGPKHAMNARVFSAVRILTNHVAHPIRHSTALSMSQQPLACPFLFFCPSWIWLGATLAQEVIADVWQ